MIKIKSIGSLIGLKKEFTDQYIILHRHTFPGVLRRIAQSNIANYSIFLADGILLGIYDYTGDDHEGDMKAMGEDDTTRQWWQLTDNMQQPLPHRKPGEWWTVPDHIYSFKAADGHPAASRRAFRCLIGSVQPEEIIAQCQPGTIRRAEAFHDSSGLYLYFETTGDPGLESIIKTTGGMVEMQEVFHTDGCLNSARKIFVTGCFDMLHSGHVAFLKEASGFGDLYVGIGSDVNVNNLKGRFPVNTEHERKYMLDSVRYVHHCSVNKGWGIMDFLQELEEIRPDVFVVNEDGHTPEKEELCKRLGIEYKVLKRIPHEGLPARSTTSLRTECRIPFRIDLAGGWLDQPFVSKYYPGPVLTISIEPTLEFNDRSGMASSTRRKAIELWKTDIPPGEPEKLAKMLFSYDNPPGTLDVSGSQDALGIVLPGLNRLDYDSHYWPDKITSVHDEEILQWLENHLYLVTLGPRTGSYTVVDNSIVNEAGARNLSEAAKNCWDSILVQDIMQFGKNFRASFEAQVAMFPNMADEGIYRTIERYREKALGWKLSGAGGGGYLILVSDKEIEGAFRIKIRRKGQY